MSAARITLAIACMAMLSACIKEELPVPAYPRGDAREVRFCMGQGYQMQYWVDLGSGEAVRENTLMAWDLAFEGGPEGWRIMLNGGRLMLAWDTGLPVIDAAVDVQQTALQGRFDAASGHPDSTAIGDWRNTRPLIVIDMGYDAQGNPIGHRRIRPVEVSASAYTLELAQADGSDAVIVSVPKDPQRHWTHFAFGQGALQVAPSNGQWHIVLTRYTHFFAEDDLPYLVVGAFIDGAHTRVLRLPDADFATVELADTLGHPFLRRRDIIGYDWKEYDFDAGRYEVDARRVYILQVSDGRFFKLRFLDYYGTSGQAGCPLFAVQAL
ncbi:MAG: HmuY family protein [Flavobacteriales bacterium]|nr:HmuY family protein [Flavobacteriales bacterium]